MQLLPPRVYVFPVILVTFTSNVGFYPHIACLSSLLCYSILFPFLIPQEILQQKQYQCCCCCCCCWLWFMGPTPLFELFTGPLSFHLANYMQRFGWGYSSEKSNPRLPRQTGVNRTVRLLMVLLQLAVKEGTISYIIQRLYSIKCNIIYVLYYITVSRDQIQESPPVSYGI